MTNAQQQTNQAIAALRSIAFNPNASPAARQAARDQITAAFDREAAAKQQHTAAFDREAAAKQQQAGR